jgi:hypothetical protein
MADVKSDGGGELFRLVYASRAVLPILPRFEATVQEILTASQRNNERLDVTGLLLAHQGWFVQALEGPRRNVSQVFGMIGRDLRHAQLELLTGGPAQGRLFGQWSMCARTITPQAGPVLKTLELAGEFDPFRLEGEKALALLVAISKVPAPRAMKKAG